MKRPVFAFFATLALTHCTGVIGPATDAAPRADARDSSAPRDGAALFDAGATDALEPDAATPPPPTEGSRMFERAVQPLLAERCGACHLGPRFGVTTLERAGAEFTAEETARNYGAWRLMLSLDAPRHSRVLAKLLPDGDPRGLAHAGGALTREGEPLYETLYAWAEQEKRDRCPECGLASPRQFLAYVRQPAIHWAIPREPTNDNYGQRRGARIVMQPLEPGTMRPRGEPVDFLPEGFCGPAGECDFGYLASSYAGDRVAFECRLRGDAAQYFYAAWNLCVAEVGPDGRAVNPRFLRPAAERHRGFTFARTTPFGVLNEAGEPLKGPYDGHFRVRRRGDNTPAFSPDDRRVYFASRGLDPRTGVDGMQSYHGFEHTNNVLAVRVGADDSGASVDGSDPRTIYVNEGGVADLPFFLRNGNVAFHTWNLERTDRHMYVQSTADGMMEMPVLFGRLQGPNMWGRAAQIANGALMGVTGRRRSQLENYVAFVADHTLGIGAALNPDLPALRIFDEAALAELQDFVFCEAPPEGPGCTLSRLVEDLAYAPDGRAFVAHTSRRVYTSQGEELMNRYAAREGSLEERWRSVERFLPRELGISLVDHRGNLEVFARPAEGFMLRYPTWVGRREAPIAQPWRADERARDAEVHVADVPLWFAFQLTGGERTIRSQMAQLDRITSLRVLVKEMGANAGMNDGYPYREAVNGGEHDHPTHLGINNATGYTQLLAPEGAGADAFGDVRVREDRSARVRVPAGKLLLFQGVDAQGHVVAQHTRVFAMPPGQRADASVRRAQYAAQCGACHGALGDEAPRGLREVAMLPSGALDFDTQAAREPAVDLASEGTRSRRLSFLHTVRPLMDRACVSCHSGASPAGELSLEREYSATANYPAGRWASARFTAAAYLDAVPPERRVPGYAFSMTYAYMMRNEDPLYRARYAAQIASHAPLGRLAPWDPAYQNLFATDDERFVYLSDAQPVVNFGRGDRLGGMSRDSFLIEVLTGRDANPRRDFHGVDHTRFLTDAEARAVMAVIDVGFPYMLRGDDRAAPEGPNAGRPWVDLAITPLH